MSPHLFSLLSVWNLGVTSGAPAVNFVNESCALKMAEQKTGSIQGIRRPSGDSTSGFLTSRLFSLDGLTVIYLSATLSLSYIELEAFPN